MFTLSWAQSLRSGSGTGTSTRYVAGPCSAIEVIRAVTRAARSGLVKRLRRRLTAMAVRLSLGNPRSERVEPPACCVKSLLRPTCRRSNCRDAALLERVRRYTARSSDGRRRACQRCSPGCGRTIWSALLVNNYLMGRNRRAPTCSTGTK